MSPVPPTHTRLLDMIVNSCINFQSCRFNSIFKLLVTKLNSQNLWFSDKKKRELSLKTNKCSIFIKNRICTTTYDCEELCRISFMLAEYFLKFAAHKLNFQNLQFSDKKQRFYLKIIIQPDFLTICIATLGTNYACEVLLKSNKWLRRRSADKLSIHPSRQTESLKTIYLPTH